MSAEYQHGNLPKLLVIAHSSRTRTHGWEAMFIHACRWVVSCALVLWALASAANGADSKIGASDVIALYRANAAKASTVQMVWQWSDAILQSNYDYRIAYADHLEKRVKGKADSQLHQMIKREREAVTKPLSNYQHGLVQEFLSDRENFQFRHPLGRDRSPFVNSNVPPEFSFPSSVPTPDSLVTDFRDVSITSWGPATQLQYRKWTGDTLRPGIMTAVAGPIPSEAMLRLPPLSIPPAESAIAKAAHWIDQVFTESDAPAKIVGEAEVSGIETVVLERILPCRGITPTWPEVHLVYCDLRRGGLPVRIESYIPSDNANPSAAWKSLPWDGKPVGPDRITPGRILSTTRVEEFDGVFVPMEGIVERMGPRDAAADADTIVHGWEKWAIKSLVINQPIPEHVFALQFPAGTIIANTASARHSIVGNIDDVADKLIVSLPRVQPSRAIFRSLLWAMPAVAFLGLVGAVLVRRRLSA